MIKIKLRNKITAAIIASFTLIFANAALKPNLPCLQNINSCYARRTTDKLAIFAVNEINNEPLMTVLFTPNDNETKTKVISFNPQNFTIQENGDTKILSKTFKQDGADATLNIINDIFKTDIQKQMTINTSQLAAIIDLFDGWETEIKKADAIKTNENLKCDVAAFKDCEPIEDFDGDSKRIKLNGAQLLAYSAVNPEVFVDIFKFFKDQLFSLLNIGIKMKGSCNLNELKDFAENILFLKPIIK